MTTTETTSRPDLDQPTAPAGGLPGAVLRRVVEHIDANLHRDPRLAELGALAHMSTFHFARLFKASTGLSPHRFIVARRLDRAKALLTTDVAPIAAISRTVGFRTPSHFTTVFRRSTGMTPSVYRSTAPAPDPPPVTSGSPSAEPSPGQSWEHS